MNGYQWLESIADSMRSAIANGAVPTPERLTVRELLDRFGYLRRGDWINSHIRNGLEKYKLGTDRDFAVIWIDSPISIYLETDASDVSNSHTLPDPTHRIGSLPAANRTPKSVRPDDPLSVATTIMQLHDYSQLPVMTTEREVKGIITWKSIGARLSLGLTCEYVRDCMDCPAEELPETIRLFDAINTIAQHEYVLVRGTDKAIIGIVTASDLSFQFMQLAGPFLFVGEIEGYLRHLIHGRFTLDQLQSASSSEEGRTIGGSADLTLGSYCKLLERKENWAILGLNIDRNEFVWYLDKVRQVRNDVMHFTSDWRSDNDISKLREMAQFFENLVAYGVLR